MPYITERALAWAMSAAALGVAMGGGQAQAQSAWRPDRTIEFVVPTAAGGNNDRLVRLVQKILVERKLLPTPAVVLNKSGGNQYLAVVYLSQHPRDGHYVMLTNPSIITNDVNGISKERYSHLTPLALMIVESNAITVSAGSTMKNMRDLVARLRENPESVSFAMPSRGGVPHLGLAAAVKAAGLDPKKLKIVVFKTSGESITAVAGGHVDAMVSSLASVMGGMQAGKLRVLGLAAKERRGGAAAHIPTLAEQGIATDGVDSWRGLSGAPGLAAAQVAYWDEALAKAFESEDWKAYLAQNDLPAAQLRAREFTGYLQSQYESTRALLTEIGLAR